MKGVELKYVFSLHINDTFNTKWVAINSIRFFALATNRDERNVKDGAA